MKKLILLLMFLMSGAILAQEKLTNKIPIDWGSVPVSVMYVQVGDDYYPALADTNGNISISIPVGNSSSGGGANTITSVEVLASSQTVKETTITNYTNGSILYYGFDNTVTASNGQPLFYLDSKTFTKDNLEDIWLISSSSTDVRYDWEN